MEQDKSIVLIICYYGKFPWYFAFFLHSCQFNSTIDFFIVTDIINYKKPLPNNVKFVFKSIDDIIEIASKKLGFRVKIDRPYKLCDFKPAYGLIFSDIIANYDFWGQGDLDIIYGNLRTFLNDKMLSSFDFISVRHDYTTGCFALYKNNNLMNNLFKRSKDYEKVFSDPTHFCFDECNFKHDLLTDGTSIFDIDSEIESFTHVIKAAEQIGEINAHFDFILLEGLPGKIKFKNGEIFYKNTFEAIAYHFFWLKRVYHPKRAPKCIDNTYFISQTKIYFKKN